jgi:hydroxymethylpyrimidine/phosphomethylpyrimidine kinase
VTERFSVRFLEFHRGKIMADLANRYPENFPGKLLQLCLETAPVDFKGNDDDGHSYVYKQPENSDEEAKCKESDGGPPGRSNRQRRRVATVTALKSLKRLESHAKIQSTINYQSSASLPVALTVAGSDSSAGAGIQADLKTFIALRIYGVTAITCAVAEIPGKVSRIEPVSAEMVRAQIEVLVKNFPIAAVKTGLLYSNGIISVVARSIVDFVQGIPLVIDPVITATGGDPLLEHDAIETYQRELFPLATLITPNLDEAMQLVGEKIDNYQSMKNAGKKLEGKFKTAILLKGGHLAGHDAVDLLFADGKVTEFSAPFVRDVATHGTGCTYSAAIVAGLAEGMKLEAAIARAKKFVSACIQNRLRWVTKSGSIDALRHSS